MQRLKVFGLALAAVFILSIVVAASASAVESPLPQFSVETGFTAKFGKSKLNLNGANITSAKGTATGTPTNKRLGKFDIMFEGSKLGGKECHSLGDTTELILVTGEYHLVPLPKDKKHYLVAFLINETHIECAFLNILVLIIKGSVVLGLWSPAKGEPADTTKFSLLVAVKEEKQEFNEYLNNNNEVVKTELKGKVGEGAELPATQEDENVEVTTEKLTEGLEK